MVVEPGRIGHCNDIVSGIQSAVIAAFGGMETFGFLHSVRGASSSSLTPLYLLHVKRDGTNGRATMDAEIHWIDVLCDLSLSFRSSISLSLLDKLVMLAFWQRNDRQ